MNWILLGVVVLLVQRQHRTSYCTMASPLLLSGIPQKLNPFIKHWEPASFDRKILDEAHLEHTRQQKTRREKRELKFYEYGPFNTIKVNFNAHDREFRLILRQDPISVFVPDVEIENTFGPFNYDISRVYTGTLEDDENSHVHAVLTSDNLLDGTISTNSENFYIEPSERYSNELPKHGIHSIVYKLSDVKMQKSLLPTVDTPIIGGEHCASEKLRKKLIAKEFKRRRKSIKENDNSFRISSNLGPSNGISSSHNRFRRWLPEENSDPPLPLDLDMPYNDEVSLFTHNPVKDSTAVVNRIPMKATDSYLGHTETTKINLSNGINSKTNRTPNILVGNYNPNNDFNLRNHLTNRNILIGNYNSSTNQRENTFFYNYNNNNNNNYNGYRIRGVNSTSRPSHKTHVEIITKNGATKKPNIIVNNFNPDIIMTSQIFNNHIPMRNDFIDINLSKTSYEKKSTCMLYLQADHTFFQKMGSDEASIETITRHVQRANAIYRNTDFNGDGKPDNITFMIKRIKVHNMNALKDPTYRFPGNYGVEKFLELFSEEDYDAFCLAYMFTYRDFEMGTLGLAWTGDLKNAGGVCEKNGHYRGSLKSLNTGIVTLLNYGKHVPPAVSHVTLAHEIGHNFGSPHDPEQCTPGGEDGNYIMFARATSGDKRNNNKFSPCSLKSIEPVLNAKARSSKGCFTEPQQSICGNGVVEPGEQCDCGWEEDCKDTCCFPMSRHPRIDEKPCTLTSRSMCSPSQGPCCTSDCKLKFGDKCRDDNGCRDPSFCDGRMPHCPQSINKPNKTICNKEFVCYMGECTGSICLAYGLESCQCLPGPNDPKTKSCELCCKQPGEGNLCKSSFEWNEPPFDVPDMFAKPGTPCNDYNGYCDVFQKCREVDPSGPLATLRKLLLSEESIASFKKWIQSNWYTVALALAGVIVLLIMSTKLLGKRSNLKLKSVTIIHSATTETVRLPEDNNGVIVHTAIRKKVPFKKKVRGDRTKKSSKVLNTNNKINHGTTKIDNSKDTATVINKLAKRKLKTNEPIKKIGRINNRISATVSPDESPKSADTKKLKKNKKHKSIIDYSTNNSGNHTNTFSKVHKWLLESPIVSQPLSNIEHSSKIQKVLSKSQSTPERLTQKSPKKVKSLGNLNNEKVKLQVVYKPPFKFSLKLSKNSAVKTHVIGTGLNRSKRKSRNKDKKYNGSTKMTEHHGRRTALLVRTKIDESKIPIVDTSEPNYETLNIKSQNEYPLYENLTAKNFDNSKLENSIQDDNSKNFKNNSIHPINNIVRQASISASSRRNSIAHINKKNSITSNSTENQYMNLNRKFNSTQNLMQPELNNWPLKSKKRSSLNLKTSGFNHNLSRPSLINKQRSSSNQNLIKENNSLSTNLRTNDSSSVGNLSRNNYNNNNNNNIGNNQMSSVLIRGSSNNIPRASLIHTTVSASVSLAPPAFIRQTSLQVKPMPQANTSYNFSPNNSFNEKNYNKNFSQSNNIRPHTAACDNVRQFEWPKVLSTKDKTDKDRKPIPSDLEVMVSDVENLVS